MAQRYYQVRFFRTFSKNSKTGITTYYSRSSGLHLKGDWLAEVGFDTGVSVTGKISEGCLILRAESNEKHKLRNEFYQVKQVVKGMKAGISGVLRENKK